MNITEEEEFFSLEPPRAPDPIGGSGLIYNFSSFEGSYGLNHR
jgi:hypothetical protein